MKKFLLAVFLLCDIALIGGSAFVLVTYVKRKLPLISQDSKVIVTPPADTGASSATVKLSGVATSSTASSVTTEGNVRKILFTYRNSKAKQVAIRSDFTGWKPEPMQKAPDGSWKYQAHLTPGEYAYCFTVGDKIINDPANKRTKTIGRTTVSSIVVEALPAKPTK